MSMKRVLVACRFFPSVGLDVLDKEVETTVLPYMDCDPESLIEIRRHLERGYDGLIWNTKHKLTKDLLDLAGPRLKAISTMSSGVDNIDVEEVQRRGIPLGNTLQVLDSSVADLAIGLMIAAGRKFKEGVRQLERGEWKYGVQQISGRDIAGSTVGIVGLGGIGQAVVQRLRAFRVHRFLYSGRNDKTEAKVMEVERVSREQLFRESDYIVLACPLTAETKHLVNADAIKLMKETVILVNVGRGGLIDQDALYIALEERRIFAAGLDVTSPEPLPSDHPLVAQPNCYILPHLGCATEETRNATAIIAAENVLLALDGKPMRYSAFATDSPNVLKL